MIKMKFVCASGLTSSLFAKFIEQRIKQENLPVQVSVVSANHLAKEIESTDILVCFPLFAFQLSDIEKIAHGYCKVLEMKMEDLHLTNHKKILDDALNLYYA